MQVDTRFLPPDFDPGASFIWFVLGLALLEFLLFVICFHRIAVAEEKRIKESLLENSENGKFPDAASGELKLGRKELGTDRGKIWSADDFDAPLPDEIMADFLETDIPHKKQRKR